MRAPALYALIFFVSGILAGSNLEIPAIAYLGLASIATVAAIIYSLVERTIFARIALCLALLASGAFLTRVQLREFPSNHISHFTQLEGKSTVFGRISEEPDLRPSKTFLVVGADSLTHGGLTIPISGLLRVRILRATSEFNIDDEVKFTGFVVQPPDSRNPGSFDYRRYLELRQIHAVCNLTRADRVDLIETASSPSFVRSAVAPVRRYITGVFEQFLPPEQSAIMRGFLIGDVRFIPRSVYDRFKDTGTLHVLAASGSNVGYVTATLFLLAQAFRIPRKSRYALAIVGVALFSFLAYNQPSVVRASIMAIVALLGLLLHRDKNWLNTISIAGLIILAIHPLYLYDLGTQLSFAAAFALILFMPALEPMLPNSTTWYFKLVRYTLLLLLVSIVAQLGVMPVLLYHFHTVPLVSFLSNLVVVPLVGVASTIGILLIFVSAMPFVAGLFGQVLSISTQAILWAVEFFENLQIPPIQIGAPEFLTVLTYYLVMQVALALKTKSRHLVAFAFLLVIALNAVVWKSVIAGPDRNTKVTILDTGSITTIFVNESDGKRVLINGGGKSDYFDSGESVVLPFLQNRGIGTVDQFLATTDRDGNLYSLQTVMESLMGTYDSNSIDSPGCKLVDPALSLEVDRYKLLFLTEFVSLEEVASTVANPGLLGLDWKYLENGIAGRAIELFQPEAVVITDYRFRYAKLDNLRELRVEHPKIPIYSVFENGAIELEIDNEQAQPMVSIQ